MLRPTRKACTGQADEVASSTAWSGSRTIASLWPPYAANWAGTPAKTGSACPVQAFRVGRNIYATQFHPELDLDGIRTRIEVYKNAGYFDPREADAVKATSGAVAVSHPMTVLANFVRLHRR
jgi:GMP synthase (glutamine-hydrolysing)